MVGFILQYFPMVKIYGILPFLLFTWYHNFRLAEDIVAMCAHPLTDLEEYRQNVVLREDYCYFPRIFVSRLCVTFLNPFVLHLLAHKGVVELEEGHWLEKSLHSYISHVLWRMDESYIDAQMGLGFSL